MRYVSPAPAGSTSPEDNGVHPPALPITSCWNPTSASSRLEYPMNAGTALRSATRDYSFAPTLGGEAQSRFNNRFQLTSSGERAGQAFSNSSPAFPGGLFSHRERPGDGIEPQDRTFLPGMTRESASLCVVLFAAPSPIAPIISSHALGKNGHHRRSQICILSAEATSNSSPVALIKSRPHAIHSESLPTTVAGVALLTGSGTSSCQIRACTFSGTMK